MLIKKSLTTEDLKNVYSQKKKLMKDMNIFRSKYHDVYSTTVNKIALSSNDDKRKIKSDKINTLALRLDSSN